MKIARMLFVAALMSGLGQAANAQEKSVAQTSNKANAQPQTDQEQAKRDQLRIAVQEICPTSGERLGSMGKPMKVKVGEETLFLCCKGCLKKKIDPMHWGTIHANVAKAQRVCPVMKQELPKNPKWTFVEGQIVYVCCPPCTKKIKAEPAKFLKQVDELYTTSLEEKRTNR